MKPWIVKTAEEMQARAAALLPDIIAAKTVFLRGELGSGKTTFAQGVGKALGVEQPLRSPTFTLVNVYQTHHPIIKTLVHADLYRLETVDRYGWRDLGLEEFVRDPSTLVLVEWPERLLFACEESLTISFAIEKNGHQVLL